MPTISANTGYYQHYMDLTLNGQNYGGNYSSLHYRYYIHRSISAGSGSFVLSGGRNFQVNVAGNVNSQNLTYDWRAYADRTMIEGDINIGHDANGYANVGFSFAFAGQSSSFPAASGSGGYDLPRIPKPPQVPGTPTLSSNNPTQINAAWGVPDNMGAGITNYRVYYGTDPALAGASYVDTGSSGNSYTLTGLTPGRIWYVAVYAQNSQGFSGRSGIAALRVGIGGRIWDGTSERPLVTAKVWNGTAEVDLAVANIWDGTIERTSV